MFKTVLGIVILTRLWPTMNQQLKPFSPQYIPCKDLNGGTNFSRGSPASPTPVVLSTYSLSWFIHETFQGPRGKKSISIVFPMALHFFLILHSYTACTYGCF